MPLAPDRDKLRSHLTKDRRKRRSRYVRLTKKEKDIADAIAVGIGRARDRVRARRLREAIERNNLLDVQTSLDTDSLNTPYNALGNLFANAIVDDAQREANRLGLGIRFDIVNPNVVRVAQNQAAQLVTRLTSEQRKSVNQAIVDAVMGRFSTDETARIIRSSIGLTDRYTQSVATRYQDVRDRAIRDNVKPTKASELAATQASKYADKLIRARAKTIARTEIAAATNYGRQLTWERAVEEGLLGADTKKRWVLAVDACDICKAIAESYDDDDAKPSIFGEFSDPRLAVGEASGWHGLTPPVHPNCRCFVSILSPTRFL